jgi:hypothetical protein
MLQVGTVPLSTDKNETETEQKQNATVFYMFRFCFILSTRSGQMQLSELIMWRIKENEEKDDDVCLAAAGFIFHTSRVSE